MDYKQKIIDAVESVEDVRWLAFLYGLVDQAIFRIKELDAKEGR